MKNLGMIISIRPPSLFNKVCLSAFNNFNNKGNIMDITGLIIFLAIGAIAGWLAGTFMKGGGFGLLGNIVVGVIGAVLGGFVFGLLGISAGGFIGSIVTATVGAVLLLFIIGIVKKA